MLFIGLESVPGEADKWEEEQWVGTASSRNYRGTVIRPFISCDCETGKTRTKFTICKSSVNKEEWQGGHWGVCWRPVWAEIQAAVVLDYFFKHLSIADGLRRHIISLHSKGQTGLLVLMKVLHFPSPGFLSSTHRWYLAFFRSLCEIVSSDSRHLKCWHAATAATATKNIVPPLGLRTPLSSSAPMSLHQTSLEKLSAFLVLTEF